MSEQLLVNRTREMYSPIRRNTRRQRNTSAFDKKGSKEEDRQEENDVTERKRKKEEWIRRFKTASKCQN